MKWRYDVIDARAGTTATTEDLLSVSIHRGVVPRSSMTDDLPRAEDLSNYKVVRRGDLVVNRMRAFQGAVGLARTSGVVSPDYLVLRPKPDTGARYLHHLLRSDWFVGQMIARLRGIGSTEQGNVRTPRINAEDLGEIVAPTIHVDDQRAIADYLDTETARIDALITKKRRMIELLDERWRAHVDRATATGKPVQVRYVTALRTSGPRGWADRVGHIGQPFIRSANLRRDRIDLKTDDLVFVEASDTPEARRSMTAVGDTLVGITGANTGWVGGVDERTAGGFVSQHVAILRPRGVVPQWLTYSIFAPRAQDQLLGGQYGGTKTQLGLEDLAELRIFIPSRQEQLGILADLEAARAGLQRATQALAAQAALLVEHRQALITAAVTGELEIPVAA